MQVETIVYRGKLLIFSKKTDFCDPKFRASEVLKFGLGIFGIPSTCSYNGSSKFCFNGGKLLTFTESTLRLLQLFPVSGNEAIAKIIITHDNGQSCFEVGFELLKDNMSIR